MEDRIRGLCSQLLANKEEQDIRATLAELREALRVYVERLRERYGTYPLLVERRKRNDAYRLHRDEDEESEKTSAIDVRS